MEPNPIRRETKKKHYKTDHLTTTRGLPMAKDVTQEVNKVSDTASGTAVAAAQNGAVTAMSEDDALFSRMMTDAGGGLSKDQADNLVPLIYLLQPLSPQVMKGDAARIEGAEAGDIWLRNAEPPIIKGDKEGMLFQPCYFYKDLVEWLPDRGGYAGRHDISCLPNVATKKGWTGTLANDVSEITDPDEPNKFPAYVRKSNGNIIVETRYFVGYVYPEVGQPMPFVIPLSSTGHGFGKQWMFLQNSQVVKDPKTGTMIPNDKSWVFLYRLNTVMKSNKSGSWYMYSVRKERMVKTMEEYDRGFELNKAFASGTKTTDYDTMQSEGESGTLNNEEM